ncbi:unnamed protein product [Protopolystoma xenopodis]|uniref:Uncharacterized protein n=1 Tax=Protopolystoma xenopodis TaxID=117903 RepID=A0A3S5A8K2_9PLAT|nr:unnamed protein product [Protopolystoma xenopodis]
MTRLTDDADYDADYYAREPSENFSGPQSESGNDGAYYPLGFPANMTKLRKQGQTTSKHCCAHQLVTKLFKCNSFYFLSDILLCLERRIE